MFCKQCGNEILDLSLKKCPKCNTTIGKGGRFCPDCGKKLGQGEKCTCSLKKEEEIPKTEPSPVKETDKSVIKDVNPNTEIQEKEEPKPEVNKRIAGNPLLEKIARGEKDKSKEIIQQEAAKIVYGKEKVEEFERQREEAERVALESKNTKAKEEFSQPKVQEIKPIAREISEKCEEKSNEPSKKCEKQEGKPLKMCKEDISTPSAASLEQKQDSATDANNAQVQNVFGMGIEKQVRPEIPQPVSNQNIEDSKNLFPEAFSPANMQYNRQNQAPVMHGPVSKPAYQQTAKKRKIFDGMWVAGLICSILSLSGVKFIPFLVFFILSLLFGIIDIFLNEKKTGAGILIGDAIIGIYFLISTLGGVL